MNEVLLDAFHHKTWATKELLEFCRGLSEEQLTSSVTGGFGSILATFNHLILSDAGYVRRFSGSVPAWAMDRSESADLDQLKTRVEELDQIWEQVLSEPIDAERVLILDEGTYETHVGVMIAQALYHPTAHREQICTILTSLGLEPPDVQVWGYADATGRGRERITHNAQPAS